MCCSPLLRGGLTAKNILAGSEARGEIPDGDGEQWLAWIPTPRVVQHLVGEGVGIDNCADRPASAVRWARAGDTEAVADMEAMGLPLGSADLRQRAVRVQLNRERRGIVEDSLGETDGERRRDQHAQQGITRSEDLSSPTGRQPTATIQSLHDAERQLNEYHVLTALSRRGL